MKWKTILKKLQKLTPEELEQEAVLFYGDGGTYSEIIGAGKTRKTNENLGCEDIDQPSGWQKGQFYLIHST